MKRINNGDYRDNLINGIFYYIRSMMKKRDKSIHKAPGRSDREKITVIKLFKMFPDEGVARKWFEDIKWEKERQCGHCESINTKQIKSEKPMPYWCSDYRSYFSVRTETPMQSSKTSLRRWVIGIYLMNFNLKGVSSMKLHRDLGIVQSCTWHMAQRIREGWVTDDKVTSDFTTCPYNSLTLKGL